MRAKADHFGWRKGTLRRMSSLTLDILGIIKVEIYELGTGLQWLGLLVQD